MSPPKVLIIGAGISGLTLAQLLRKQGIPFEIFERDANPSARGTGYALGLYDLEATFAGDLLPSDLPPFQTACHLVPLPLPSQLVLYLPDGKIAKVQDTPETPCLRVVRRKLREVLSTNVEIQWGKRAVDVAVLESDPDRGVVAVTFDDGTKARGDVLVAADGTFSAVRPHVLGRPNEQVLRRFPAAVTSGAGIKLRGKEFERQLELGHSAALFSGPEKRFNFFVGLNRVHKVLVEEEQEEEEGPGGGGKKEVLEGEYYWIMTEFDTGVVDDEAHWTKTASKREKLERARRNVRGLARKEFGVVVEKSEVDDISEGWSALWDAFIEEVPPVDRVVLIGDAAHPMTPLGGDGAVLAIRDSIALSKVLAKCDTADMEMMRAQLDEVQKEILKRGLESIKISRGVSTEGLGEKRTPRAWGYELSYIDQVEPLPIKLT